jgi:hypothetical protein
MVRHGKEKPVTHGAGALHVDFCDFRPPNCLLRMSKSGSKLIVRLVKGSTSAPGTDSESPTTLVSGIPEPPHTLGIAQIGKALSTRFVNGHSFLCSGNYLGPLRLSAENGVRRYVSSRNIFSTVSSAVWSFRFVAAFSATKASCSSIMSWQREARTTSFSVEVI